MTASVHELKLSAPAALIKLRELATKSELVIFLPHAKQRMRERKIDRSQVMACLRLGQITEGPYRANKSGFWRICVQRFAAGEEIRLAVEFTEGFGGLLIVTVIN